MATTEITIPDVGDERLAIVGERVLVIKVDYDHMPDNPLEPGRGNGTIHSFNRRHGNFNLDAIMLVGRNPDSGEPDPEYEADPDCVVLSYYEHGDLVWFVQGRSRTPPDMQWDGSYLAGVWEPDKDVRKEADDSGLKRGSPERIEFMETRAASVCREYTDWCNGHVYGYDMRLYQLKRDEDGEPIDEIEYYKEREPVAEDSYWGYVGDEGLEQEVRGAAERLLEGR